MRVSVCFRDGVPFRAFECVCPRWRSVTNVCVRGVCDQEGIVVCGASHLRSRSGQLRL